jgi:hypothetical protein
VTYEYRKGNEKKYSNITQEHLQDASKRIKRALQIGLNKSYQALLKALP